MERSKKHLRAGDIPALLIVFAVATAACMPLVSASLPVKYPAGLAPRR